MKRALIVKIGAIGDVVMALPLLPYLREKYPNLHITWVAGQIVKPLLEATQAIDLILTVDETALFKSSLINKVTELVKIQKKLAGKLFDLTITGHVDWRYKLISLFVKSQKKSSFQRGDQRQNPVPGRYHADEYLRLASNEDASSMPKARFPSLFLPKLQLQFGNEKLVALAPGGAKNILADDSLRRWPIQNYVELAKNLQKRGISILLTGSLSDEWIIPYFSEIPITNLIGKINLLELVSLFQKCSLVITHDSGPLHLAKLAGCPIIGLFGPTNPWEKCSTEENISILWGGEKLACRPCYDGKTYAQCTNNKCLQEIRPEQVFQKSLEILNMASTKSIPHISSPHCEPVC